MIALPVAQWLSQRRKCRRRFLLKKRFVNACFPSQNLGHSGHICNVIGNQATIRCHWYIVILHPFINGRVLCEILLRGVFGVARLFQMTEQVLRLMRREARAVTIGFTLLCTWRYPSKCIFFQY